MIEDLENANKSILELKHALFTMSIDDIKKLRAETPEHLIEEIKEEYNNLK